MRLTLEGEVRVLRVRLGFGVRKGFTVSLGLGFGVGLRFGWGGGSG